MVNILKDTQLQPGEIAFAVSIDVEGQRYRLTGIAPSPTVQTGRDLANVILDFFNGHLGTNYQVAEGDQDDRLESISKRLGERVPKAEKRECAKPGETQN